MAREEATRASAQAWARGSNAVAHGTAHTHLEQAACANLDSPQLKALGNGLNKLRLAPPRAADAAPQRPSRDSANAD